MLLLMYFFRYEIYLIVYLFWEDNDYINNLVGEVVEFFIGNFGYYRNGFDIVVVKNNSNLWKGLYMYIVFYK